MPGNCSIYRSWVTGDSLTASDLTTSFTTVGVTNMTPQCLDDYSLDLTQMQSTTDPYPGAVASLATSTAGELERIRYVIKNIFGFTQWYTHSENLNFGSKTLTFTKLAAVDAKGDLLAGTAADTFTRLPVGTNNQILAADSAEATGLKWVAVDGAPGAIPKSIVDAKGDILAATAADTITRLAVGANNFVLTADSAQATGLKWAASAIGLSEITGLKLSNNSGDATNDIDIAVGAAISEDSAIADRVLLSLTSAYTKQLDVAWSVGTAQGGLDTGAVGNGTYHVFLIMRSDTGVVDVLFSLSATAPTLPANYDKFRRIGSILRESAAIVPFVQDADLFQRKASVLSYNASPGTTNAFTITLHVPTGINVLADVNLYSTSGSGTCLTLLSDLAVDDEAPSVTAAPLASLEGSPVSGSLTDLGQGPIRVRTNTSAQIRGRVGTGAQTVRVATLGWTDRRGRG